MGEPVTMMRDLFSPPVIERPSHVCRDMVFDYGGRLLRVHRADYGTDAAAPVILEELCEFGTTLRGQLSIWSLDGVRRALSCSQARALK
jgi:hypothetical protein